MGCGAGQVSQGERDMLERLGRDPGCPPCLNRCLGDRAYRSLRRVPPIGPRDLVARAWSPRSRLRRGGHGESTAPALGVETRASIVVAMNELRVLAPRAEDRSEFGAAAKLDLPIGGRVHNTQRTAFGGKPTSAERLAL